MTAFTIIGWGAFLGGLILMVLALPIVIEPSPREVSPYWVP